MLVWTLLACEDPETPAIPESADRTLDLVDLGPTIDAQSVALSGGGVAVLGDGRIAATDVDGDRVVIIDPTDPEEGVEILFPSGWAPDRLIASDDVLHVTLRGPGSLASISTGPLALEALVAVCPAPRGIDVADDGTVWLACQGGELAAVTDGVPTVRVIEPDLRDVIALDDGTLWVTTLRHASLLRIDAETGAVLTRSVPPSEDGSEPHVAWRTTRSPEGGLSMLHQVHSVEPIDLEPDPADPHAAQYGGDDPSPCSSRVGARLTMFDDEGTPLSSASLDTALAHDLLWDGPDVLVAGTGGTVPPRSELLRFAAPDLLAGACIPASSEYLPLQGAFVSGIGMTADGPVASTRNTFGIGDLYHPLAEPDPGFDLFHRVAAPSDLACISCHADGAEDGHIWEFVGFGPRRTPDLGGGLLATAPYHWDGDLPSMTALILDTAVARMGHPFPVPTQVEALATWLDGLPARKAATAADPATLAIGEALFRDPVVGCTACHVGPALTSGSTIDVGTGKAFQVPSLLGVGLRLPAMHDGCATRLEVRLTDPACGGSAHGSTSELDASEIAALAAYLATL